jgi:single stranded DNA-binding protein (ssb)
MSAILKINILKEKKMNKVILIGRLIKDVELKTTTTDKTFARLVIAVNKGKEEANFIPVTCWNKTAELAAKYLHKGSPIIVSGSLNNNNYTDKNGNTVYGLDVLGEAIEFVPREKQEVATQDTPIKTEVVSKPKVKLEDLKIIENDDVIPF